MPPPQAPPEHAKPSHLTGAWTNEDDGRYPEPLTGHAGEHDAVGTGTTEAPEPGDTHDSDDPDGGRTEAPPADAGSTTAVSAAECAPEAPTAEPSVPTAPEPERDGPEAWGAFGPPPPYTRTEPGASPEPAAPSPEPRVAPEETPAAVPEPPVSAEGPAEAEVRPVSAAPVFGGELHTPLPGGLEERIAAVPPVPDVVWKRALFRATRGRLNLGA
ncbi:hypothetical protein [Nocardiopsis salina]|uniref:hypothetical protein n=1 Tax=Nocardiopsis salina TaxID=245836 RepID=UPI001268A9C5|nr:hypothetical protein [Nocardiopsis salina]